MFALFAVNTIKEHPYIAATIAVVLVILIIIIVRWVMSWVSSSSTSSFSLKMPSFSGGQTHTSLPVVKKTCPYQYTEGKLESMLTPEIETAAYDPAAIGVDKSVHDGHTRYAKDAFVSTTGNVAKMVTDDGLVTNTPFIGLRRPSYFASVKNDESSWQTNSSYDAQLNAGSQRVKYPF